MTKIGTVVREMGLSSRTLRYYEQVGLLTSRRQPSSSQRMYDEEALLRLRQIVVLRKLQIPIKDIVRIFESDDMAELIAAFVRKLDTIDDEIGHLEELRAVIDDFLGLMVDRGIKKVSGLALLYEETERRAAHRQQRQPEAVTPQRLEQLPLEPIRPHEISILDLPPGRMLTGQCREDGTYDDFFGARERMEIEYGIRTYPGTRDAFYQRINGDTWMFMARVPEDYVNRTVYAEAWFPGGLFVAARSFFEDFDERWGLLNEWIEQSEFWEADRDENGDLRWPAMMEELYPWDLSRRLERYQQDLFLPIRWKEEHHG